MRTGSIRLDDVPPLNPPSGGEVRWLRTVHRGLTLKVADGDVGGRVVWSGLFQPAILLGRYTQVPLFEVPGGMETLTMYYSTFVRFCDKVREILILVCRGYRSGRRVFGG
jgi:hypothetical protein